MAILGNTRQTLEIQFPYERSDAVVYVFKLKWRGIDIVNPRVRLRNEDEAADEVCFHTWDHKRDVLIDTIREALNANRAACWEPIVPYMHIGIFPECMGTYSAYRLTTPEGQTDYVEDCARLNANPTAKDYFTVQISFNMWNNFLPGDEKGPPPPDDIIFTLYATRAELTAFADQLQLEHEECSRDRKLPPLDDDTLWRLLH